MAQPLYPGCDVWLNNPLRPYEACGTSGMKAALNGGLNLSILDGWWDEWYDGNNGWAIPSADGVEDPDRRDDLEATALYDLIENEVAPRFYDTDGDGVPTRWLEMVRHTLKSLGPKVLATRMVRDYVRELYAPAAGNARRAQRRLRRGGRARRVEEEGRATPGRRSASSTSRAAASATPPRSVTCSTSRAFVVARRPRARRRRRPAACTAASTAPTSSTGTVRGLAAARREPTRAAGTASTATSTLDHTGAVRLHRARGPAQRPARLARRARGRGAAVTTARRTTG